MPRDLIGPGIRIAVRDAVGGWGPYTVNQIHDLFHSYGFVEFDENQTDVGGARRSLAEAYHARIDFSSPAEVNRYLDLVSEILQHYPPEADEAGIGRRLRHRLSLAGVNEHAGRLRLDDVGDPVATELERATAGVWSPDRIRVFVSHTSAFREPVGRLAQILNSMGLSSFVAHDAIEPSRDWQRVIEAALSTCDVLVAVVTPDFSSSKWTDQEVGWALGRGVPVIPVRFGANPYGFFGAVQGISMSQQDAAYPSKISGEIVRAMAVGAFREDRFSSRRLQTAMASVVAETFANSPNFDSTRNRFPLLAVVPVSVWAEAHLDRLSEAASSNRQIAEAFLPDGQPVPRAVDAFIATIRERRNRSQSD